MLGTDKQPKPILSQGNLWQPLLAVLTLLTFSMLALIFWVTVW